MEHFHKTIGSKNIAGINFDICVILTQFQYFPQKNEIHVCFEKLLHNHNSKVFIKEVQPNDTFWANITVKTLFNTIEATLLQNSLTSAIEAVYSTFEPGILKRFDADSFLSEAL